MPKRLQRAAGAALLGGSNTRHVESHMSAEEADPTGAFAAREIVSTRLVGAARELVFKAFTDPDHLAHWWGPNGFTNTFHEFDLRPGGTWRFVMHGPAGGRSPAECHPDSLSGGCRPSRVSVDEAQNQLRQPGRGSERTSVISVLPFLSLPTRSGSTAWSLN